MLCLLGLFFIKHLIIDFMWQGPYEFKNKGTYGHPGGLLHAAKHGLGTIAVFVAAPIWVSLLDGMWLLAIEMVAHYHIDWAKMRLNSKLGLRPERDEAFWWLLGLDQFLHQVTYLFMVGRLYV